MYFDYAATTPPNPEVLKTFEAVNRDFWANPQALHRPGARAAALLEQARLQVLTLLGAKKEHRCVFTSGATESNNTALLGAARANAARGKHVITSAVEHASVREVFRFLESEGWELTTLPVNARGAVEPEVLTAALRPDTTLVSLMHVNNEIGSINDVDQLGRVIKTKSSALFHVDAAQSVGKIPLALDGGPVDLLSFSAHKFFGLKGSGALVLKNRINLPPLLRGGGQEEGLRSGTTDPANAAALAKALRLAVEGHDEAFARALTFKERIVAAFRDIPNTELNGTLDGASPFIINFSIADIRPETVLQALAEQEIYISTVSACSTQTATQSAVVRALTGDLERARTSIRISLSALTTADEVDALIQTIGPLIEASRFTRGKGVSS